MRVFRITARQYANDPLSGVGAALAGGRWNSKGTRVGYAAGSRSLALVEMLVHVDLHCVPHDRVMVSIELPDDGVATLSPLPPGWNRLPYDPRVQAVGDKWLREGHSLALRVPSAIVPAEWNVLVNPGHPRRTEIRIGATEALTLDARLFD
ncbi:MAG TPA: RES family NAD+ phosphorylase [Rhodanobacteraceae bacterium]|nr:RES family NAD+ phosphorylase [Rhodanobacteraceae bacterium]